MPKTKPCGDDDKLSRRRVEDVVGSMGEEYATQNYVVLWILSMSIH